MSLKTIYLLCVAAILALSLNAMAQSATEGSVPSTTVSQPDAPDHEAIENEKADAAADDNAPDDSQAIQQENELESSTIKNTTPPDTSRDPTQPFNSTEPSTMIQHQLFFHVQAPCGETIKIQLVSPNGPTTTETGNYTFSATTSVSNLLDITLNNDSLTAKVPLCDSSDTAKTSDNIGHYNFSVMIKVPVETKAIGLSADYGANTSINVNTTGKDPNPVGKETQTVINLYP